MVFFNGLILVSVCRVRELREKKEVVILCLLVVSDFLYGLPTIRTFVAYFYRQVHHNTLSVAMRHHVPLSPTRFFPAISTRLRAPGR